MPYLKLDGFARGETGEMYYFLDCLPYVFSSISRVQNPEQKGYTGSRVLNAGLQGLSKPI